MSNLANCLIEGSEGAVIHLGEGNYTDKNINSVSYLTAV